TAAMGLAWRALLPGIHPGVAIWARLVRDSGSEALPLSQVGGYVLGARALALAGVPGTIAAASTIVDVTLEFVAQRAYTALGLAAGRRAAAVRRGAGDRKPPLRDPHRGLCRAQRDGGAGGRLYPARRRLRTDPGDVLGALAVEARPRPGDRVADDRGLAGDREH